MYSAFIASTLFLGTASPLIQAQPPAKPAIDKLIDQLSDPDFKVRDQASKAIEALGTDALPRLREAEKHGDAEVRRRIATCIERIETYKGKSLSEWMAPLNDYRHPDQQREARRVLGPNGPFAKIAIPELLNALKDDRWGPYSELRKTLTDYGPKGIPAFIKALKHPEWVIRFNAITLLEPLKSTAKQAAPALREALKDSNFLVRATAARALAEIDSKDKSKETIRALREALKDPDSNVRASAASALSKIDPNALPPLPAGVRRFAMPRRGVVNSPWGGKDSVDKIALSADGKVLASICRFDNKVNLCDVETGKKLRTIELAGDARGTPVLSSDSKRLVTLDHPNAVSIWDINSGKEMRHFLASDWQLSYQWDAFCNMSTDKQTVAAAAKLEHSPISAASIFVWDLTSGKVLVQRLIPGAERFSFSPDNRLLAHDLWEREPIPVPRNAIVQGLQGGRLKLYLVVEEVATGRILFKAPTEFVVNLQFSSDGRSFACIRHTLHDRNEVMPKPEFCVFELATGKQRACFPYFKQGSLAAALQEAGIEYHWIEALGGRRRSSKAKTVSPNLGLRNQGFRNYADYMLTEDFRHGVERLLEFAARKRTAMMCAEAVYWRCHRRLVSDFLSANNVKVQHIFPNGEVRPHRLTEGTRVEEGMVTYPPTSLFV
jgi:hypothetical protein